MTNHSTSETDKAERMAYSQEYMVDTEFARKLERERDEAIADCLEQARLLGMGAEREAKLIAERDVAREEAHRFRSLHYSHLGINGSASWFPWEGKLDDV